MKKTVVFALCALLLCGMTACGAKDSSAGDGLPKLPPASENAEEAALPEYTVLSEAMDAAGSDCLTAYTDSYYSIAYYEGRMPVRVVAEMTPDLMNALNGIDYTAADKDQQVRALIGNQKVISIKDLSPYITPQEDLDKRIGDKGKDLLMAQYEISTRADTEENIVYSLAYGPFTYLFTFEEAPDPGDRRPDDEILYDLTVKSAVLEGLSRNGTSLIYN